MAGTLVICRSPAALARLRRLHTDGPLMIASDDPRVQHAARALPGVQAVHFIEQRDSFYTVADEVMRVLREINGWLAGFAAPLAGAHAETLEWGSNVEGGLTTQRVQDALLLIRSYRELCRATGAKIIHLLAEPGAEWEDLVLAAVARHAAVALHRHPVQPFAGRRHSWWTRLRPHAVALYHFANVVRLGSGRRPPPACGAILFQLGSALRKHVDNVAPLMLALEARGRRTIALCWSASERATRDTAPVQLAARGLAAAALERHLTWRDLWSGCAASWRLRQRIRRAAQAAGAWRGLQHDGIALAPLLEESLHHFLVAELPQRLRYQRALAAALARARPPAFKPWAGPESFEGRTAHRLLSSHGVPPLVFHYWLGASLAWPYADSRYAPDLFLAAGPHEARHARQDYGLAAHQVEVVGQARFSGYAEFPAEVPVETSRDRLGLPAGRRFIGFDPNCALRGYQSAQEQAEMTATLISAAQRDPGLVIVVKPHPSYPIDHLQPLFAGAAPARVVILDRRAPLKDFLNAIDLVVTKYSTLILEAALMRRPAVAALFDGDDRFKVFGDLPAIVRSPAELGALLAGLGDDNAFARWQEERLGQSLKLLPEYYFQSATDPATAAAQAILQRLAAPGRP